MAERIYAVDYTDKSVASLSAGQAAGTLAVLAANPNRRALMINPSADCQLTIGAGATRGWKLFGNLPNTITGQECPADDIFIIGLTAGATVTIWEG